MLLDYVLICSFPFYISSLLQYQVIGMGFPISTPPQYYAGTKISSDPKPCQRLDKAVIKMTEYEVAVS
jgi:hypothetical protein